MLKDLTVHLEHEPGSLAVLGEALGRAMVNIEGFAGMTMEGVGLIHLLVEDAEKASRALEANDIGVVGEREVLVVDMVDRPGELGNVTRRLADGDVNVELAYLATSNRLVLGVDQTEKAREILDLS